MIITEINCETGETTTREMTEAELEQYQKMANYIPGQDESETL